MFKTTNFRDSQGWINWATQLWQREPMSAWESLSDPKWAAESHKYLVHSSSSRTMRGRLWAVSQRKMKLIPQFIQTWEMQVHNHHLLRHDHHDCPNLRRGMWEPNHKDQFQCHLRQLSYISIKHLIFLVYLASEENSREGIFLLLPRSRARCVYK